MGLSLLSGQAFSESLELLDSQIVNLTDTGFRFFQPGSMSWNAPSSYPDSSVIRLTPDSIYMNLYDTSGKLHPFRLPLNTPKTQIARKSPYKRLVDTAAYMFTLSNNTFFGTNITSFYNNQTSHMLYPQGNHALYFPDGSGEYSGQLIPTGSFFNQDHRFIKNRPNWQMVMAKSNGKVLSWFFRVYYPYGDSENKRSSDPCKYNNCNLITLERKNAKGYSDPIVVYQGVDSLERFVFDKDVNHLVVFNDGRNEFANSLTVFDLNQPDPSANPLDVSLKSDDILPVGITPDDQKLMYFYRHSDSTCLSESDLRESVIWRPDHCDTYVNNEPGEDKGSLVFSDDKRFGIMPCKNVPITENQACKSFLYVAGGKKKFYSVEDIPGLQSLFKRGKTISLEGIYSDAHNDSFSVAVRGADIRTEELKYAVMTLRVKD